MRSAQCALAAVLPFIFSFRFFALRAKKRKEKIKGSTILPQAKECVIAEAAFAAL
jgi:hypothetical protein